jgi:hypothetical protein
MKFTASILTVFAASILLLQSCGSDTSGDRAELATVLDAVADREDVPSGECRDACVVAALAEFDACTEDDAGIGREECFARAIHSFFECAEKCPRPEPPTCEEGCTLAAAAVLEECLDGPEPGAGEATCAELARKAHAACLVENCEDPEPPTCEGRCDNAATVMRDACVADDGDLDECNMDAREWSAECKAEHCTEPPTCEDACGAIATHLYEACISKLDSEERCGEIARGVQRLCNEHCEGYECPCHDDDCDDEDSDSDSHGHGDSDSHGHGHHGHGHGHHGHGHGDSDSHGGSDSHGDSDSRGDSDSGKDCDRDGPTPKKGGHCN